MIKKISFLFSAMLLLNAAAFSQAAGASEAAPQIPQEYIVGVLLLAMFLMAGIILLLVSWVVMLLKQITNGEKGEVVEEKETEEEGVLVRLFRQVKQKLTDAVPIEREKEIEFAHEYDGIRELDNSLPPWWKYLFYLTIIFAVVYLYRYHVSESAPLSIGEYEQEMAEATLQKEAFLEKAASLVNESSVTALTSTTDLANGKKTFTTLCSPCHGTLGEGKQGLGPNMTDEYWLHGGGIKNVFKTIKYGVPAKGMISWQDQMSPRQMQEVASYILTLQGTNPPNAKEPQGDKYVPGEASL